MQWVNHGNGNENGRWGNGYVGLGPSNDWQRAGSKLIGNGRPVVFCKNYGITSGGHVYVGRKTSTHCKFFHIPFPILFCVFSHNVISFCIFFRIFRIFFSFLRGP